MEGMRGFIAPPRRARCRATARASSCSSAWAGRSRSCSRARACCACTTTRSPMRDWLAACGERAGHPLRRRLRSGFATDALVALKAGYATGVLAGVDAYKLAPHYHSQRDVAANLDLGTVAAIRAICREAVALAQLRAAASSRARLRASSRVAIAPAKRSSSSCASRSPRRGPGSRRARARARRRARAGAGRASRGQRVAEQLARQLEVRGDRRLGVAAARGEPVGDGEHGDLDRPRRASPSGSARPRGGRAGARGRGSRAAGDGRHSAAT